MFATDAQRAWFGEHYAEVRRFDAELPIWGRAGRVTLFARE
jgi:hypothetical protein